MSEDGVGMEGEFLSLSLSLSTPYSCRMLVKNVLKPATQAEQQPPFYPSTCSIPWPGVAQKNRGSHIKFLLDPTLISLSNCCAKQRFADFGRVGYESIMKVIRQGRYNFESTKH